MDFYGEYKIKTTSYRLHLLHHSSVCPWKDSRRDLTPVIVYMGWKNDGKRTHEMERGEEVTLLPQKARDKDLAEHHGTCVPCPISYPEVTPAAYLLRWQDPMCDSDISPRGGGGGGRWSQVWGSIQVPAARGGRCCCCDKRHLLGDTEAISRKWHSAVIYVNKFINSSSTAPAETSEAITDAGGWIYMTHTVGVIWEVSAGQRTWVLSANTTGCWGGFTVLFPPPSSATWAVNQPLGSRNPICRRTSRIWKIRRLLFKDSYLRWGIAALPSDVFLVHK